MQEYITSTVNKENHQTSTCRNLVSEQMIPAKHRVARIYALIAPNHYKSKYANKRSMRTNTYTCISILGKHLHWRASQVSTDYEVFWRDWYKGHLKCANSRKFMSRVKQNDAFNNRP